MKVILLEDVTGTGSAGEVVEVKSGYARNMLLPSGIAIEANKTNMKTLEHRRAKIAAKKTADKEMAQSLANQLDGKQIEFTAKAGEAGKLFGSVTAQDIAESVKETLGFEIDRRKLLLDAPLKEVGLHDVRYRIYPEVEATIKVNILSEGAPILPPVEELKDTYADEALEDENDGEFYYGGEEEKAELKAGEEEPVIASDSEAIQENEAEAEAEEEPVIASDSEAIQEDEAEAEAEEEPVIASDSEAIQEDEAEAEAEEESVIASDSEAIQEDE